MELRRSFQVGRGEKFIVVEDVVTKGGRVQETIDIVRQLGGEVVGVGTLVDRSDGKVDFGVPTGESVEIADRDIRSRRVSDVPGGTPVVKPGS